MRRHGNLEPAEQRFFREAVLRNLQSPARRAHQGFGLDGPQRAPGNIFPVEGEHVAALGELLEQGGIFQLSDHDGCNLPARRAGAAIQKQAAHPERIARKRQHASQLSRTHDTDAAGAQGLRGSAFASTAAVCAARNASSAVRTAGVSLAMMAAVNSAAFFAPATPMAKVATGMPLGICTMDRSESMPLSALDWIGTPSTGIAVFAAVMPGRWAAPPAPAMMALSPRPRAAAAYS